MADMSDILGLVRAGDLTRATDAIQRRLRGDTEAEERPMRDVTPQAKTLPSPDAPKTQKAKPKRNRWSRRAGAIPYRLHLPATIAEDAPLIVMLHGCTQTPEDFATGTGMNAAAAANGAPVLWPEQLRAANANGCWNWFDPAHQGDRGEAADLAAMIRDVLVEVGTRPVHVAGLSAGGAMAAILGADHADIVASVGIHSGLPVGCAMDVGSAFGAMRSGGTAARPLKVPAIVFHGTADRTVTPANGAALLPSATGGRTRKVGGRSVTVSHKPGQPIASELWSVTGLGHAWSGGDARGSYADAKGPDATAEMLRFFAQVDAAS